MMIPLIVSSPTHEAQAECRSGIQRTGEAKPHKILVPVRVSVSDETHQRDDELFKSDYIPPRRHRTHVHL